MLLKLSLCYYRKHPAKLAVMLAILLSGTVALALTLLFVRSSKMQELENQLTLSGDYDVIAFDCEYTLAEKVTALKSVTDSGMYKRTYVTLGGNSVSAMAFRDKRSQEIFHMSMLRGTAPENADEIALDLTLAKACGISPYPGQAVNVNIDGEERSLTLTGVFEIKNETAYGGFTRYPSSAEEGYELPMIILDSSYFSVVSGLYTVFIQADKGNTEQIYLDILSLGADESLVDMTNGRGFSYSYILGTEDFGEVKSLEQTDNEISSGSAHKDIFSYIIPLFAVLIGVVTVISLYQMMKNTFDDRMRNSGIILSLGMSTSARLLQLVGEVIVITAITLPVGLLLARYIFLLTVKLTSVQNALNADRLINGVTYDPWVTTVIIISVSVLAVSLLYVCRYKKMTALALITGKSPKTGKRLIKHHRCKMRGSLFIVFSNIPYTTFSVTLLIIIGMASMSFGTLFVSEIGRFESSETKFLLEESGMKNADLSASKQEGCIIEPNTENHHDYGISPYLFEGFKENCAEDIKDTSSCIVRSSGMIILNGEYENLPYILKDKRLTPETVKDNDDGVLSFDEAEGKARLAVWEKAGYQAEDNVYSAPFVALDENGFSELELKEGSINKAEISAGRECIIAVSETSYKDISAILHTGDEITLSSIMINIAADKLDANSLTTDDFEKYGTLAYKDTVTEDGANVPMTVYCMGRRQDIKVKIGGIAAIKTDSKADFFYQNGRVNIFVTPECFKAWGLPDENLTDVSVSFKDGANIRAVDKEWYNMLGQCKGIKSASKSELLERYERERNSMKNIFLRLEGMLIMLTLTGIILALYSRLRQQRKNIAAMRAIGFTKGQLALISLMQNELLVILGAVISLLPIYAFHRLSAYAQSLKFEGSEGFVTEETAIRRTDIFLYNGVLRFDMLNKAYRKDILLVILFFAVIIGIASVIPILTQKKLRITDELKRE